MTRGSFLLENWWWNMGSNLGKLIITLCFPCFPIWGVYVKRGNKIRICLFVGICLLEVETHVHRDCFPNWLYLYLTRSFGWLYDRTRILMAKMGPSIIFCSLVKTNCWFVTCSLGFCVEILSLVQFYVVQFSVLRGAGLGVMSTRPAVMIFSDFRFAAKTRMSRD